MKEPGDWECGWNKSAEKRKGWMPVGTHPERFNVISDRFEEAG
jgi:ABC-type phosphate/phosphonate transport system permease subunit